jgi:hypothetical protein
MASFIERISNNYADPGQMANLFQNASSGAQGGQVFSGGGGSSGSDQSRYLWPDTPAEDLSGGQAMTHYGDPNKGNTTTYSNQDAGLSSDPSIVARGTPTGGAGGGTTMGYRELGSGIWKPGTPPSSAPKYMIEPKVTSTINAGPRAPQPLDLSSMDASQYYAPVKKDPLAAPKVGPRVTKPENAGTSYRPSTYYAF